MAKYSLLLKHLTPQAWHNITSPRFHLTRWFDAGNLFVDWVKRGWTNLLGQKERGGRPQINTSCCESCCFVRTVFRWFLVTSLYNSIKETCHWFHFEDAWVRRSWPACTVHVWSVLAEMKTCTVLNLTHPWSPVWGQSKEPGIGLTRKCSSVPSQQVTGVAQRFLQEGIRHVPDQYHIREQVWKCSEVRLVRKANDKYKSQNFLLQAFKTSNNCNFWS